MNSGGRSTDCVLFFCHRWSNYTLLLLTVLSLLRLLYSNYIVSQLMVDRRRLPRTPDDVVCIQRLFPHVVGGDVEFLQTYPCTVAARLQFREVSLRFASLPPLICESFFSIQPPFPSSRSCLEMVFVSQTGFSCPDLRSPRLFPPSLGRRCFPFFHRLSATVFQHLVCRYL